MKTGLRGSGDGGLEAGDTLICEDDLMRYWHDAKGRALFVVTPQRHVRSMNDLNDDELYQLWKGGIQVMYDMGLRREDLKDIIVVSVVAHQGYLLAHIHTDAGWC